MADSGKKVRRRDTYWGEEGVQRLERLSSLSGESPDKIARQALIEYELSRAQFRDTVRDTVLNLFQALIPDECYDPTDDPRQDQAVRSLGELLNAPYAAQGIADAFSLLFTENMLAMSTLRFPSVESDAESDDLNYSATEENQG